MNVTRRQFISIVAGATLLAATVVANRPFLGWLTKFISPKHTPGATDQSRFDQDTVATLVSFLGVLYGHRLTELDKRELGERIEFMVSEDAGWRPELTWLAAFLNKHSRIEGFELFRAAESGSQHKILELLFQPVNTNTSRLRAIFSAEERERRRVHGSTLGRLTELYRTSGVPWRNRGYASWPGVPGDLVEYTQPRVIPQC